LGAGRPSQNTSGISRHWPVRTDGADGGAAIAKKPIPAARLSTKHLREDGSARPPTQAPYLDKQRRHTAFAFRPNR